MPETRSGKIGPDHQLSFRKKKSPLKLLIGIAVVIVIAVAAGWLLTHLGGGAPGGRGGPGGPGGAGGPPGGGGGRGGGRGGRGGGFGGAITVGTGQAVVGAMPIQLDALGTVTPPVTATITSRIAGQLMAVYFTEGQMVKKGQKLALIDPRPYQVALDQAIGTLARDQAALANARLDLQRYTTLLAQNSIAKQQVDTQAALVKQDEAVVKTDQAAVDNAKLNLTYTSITAPVAGRVGLRLVDVGNYVQGGSGGLVVITQVDPIDVVFTVPEDNVSQINRRQRSGMPMPVTVFDRSGGQTLDQGTLSTLDNQIDTATGTVKAKARFDNGAGALFPNQFVNVRLLTDVLCNTVIVPATAVRHGSQGDYVFTLQPGNKVKMTMVTTGPSTGETIAVSKGLQGGETVITEGGDRLSDGSQVALPGQAPLGGSGFSGGRRKRPGGGAGGFGGGQGGASSQGARAFGGQGGPRGPGGAGGFQGRRGGQGAQGAAAAGAPQFTQAEGIPVAQVPAGSCSASGKGGQSPGAPGGRFGGRGFPPGGAPQGGASGAAGQGFQGRRFGPGGPGASGEAQPGQGQGAAGGFRRRGQGAPQGGQTPGQGQGG